MCKWNMLNVCEMMYFVNTNFLVFIMFYKHFLMFCWSTGEIKMYVLLYMSFIHLPTCFCSITSLFCNQNSVWVLQSWLKSEGKCRSTCQFRGAWLKRCIKGYYNSLLDQYIYLLWLGPERALLKLNVFFC